MREWYVVQVHTMREKFAASNIEDKGFHCRLPERSEMLPPLLPNGKSRRRDRLFKRVPLFRGYVLVKFDVADPRWWWINSARGVIGVLPIGAKQPVPIAAGFVDELLAKEPEDLTQEQLLELAYKYEPGDEVAVMHGPMKGQTGTFRDKRVRGLALFLALQSSIGLIEVPAQHVEPRRREPQSPAAALR